MALAGGGADTSHMGRKYQDVCLQGGSFNGESRLAPVWPHSLVLNVRLDGRMWTETYLYDGDSYEGAPMMRFVDRGAAVANDYPTYP